MSIPSKTFRSFYKNLLQPIPIKGKYTYPHKEMMKFSPTNKPIFLIPTNQIDRTEARYRAYRDIKIGDSERVSAVNKYRKAVRNNKEVEPVWVARVPKSSRHMYHNKPFALVDGHHRLTAHQAEGKRFIRGVIHGKATF